MTRDETYPVCPHDRETFVREKALYSYRCPTCEARVCLDCRRYGWKDAMIPLVDWMTGTCEDCYRQREQRSEVRRSYRNARDHRERLQRAWDEGCQAGLAGMPDDHAPNPHDVPTAEETFLIERNEWLRDEVSS